MLLVLCIYPSLLMLGNVWCPHERRWVLGVALQRSELRGAPDRRERLLGVALHRAVLGLMSPGAAGPGDSANKRSVFQYFQPPKSGPRDYHETLVGSSYTRFGSITQALSPRRPYIILIQPSLSLCLSLSLSLYICIRTLVGLVWTNKP